MSLKDPKQFQADVIHRFMDKAEYETFLVRYDEVRLKRMGGASMKAANAQDKEIFSYFKVNKSINQTAKQFGCSISRVYASIARCSVDWTKED